MFTVPLSLAGPHRRDLTAEERDAFERARLPAGSWGLLFPIPLIHAVNCLNLSDEPGSTDWVYRASRDIVGPFERGHAHAACQAVEALEPFIGKLPRYSDPITTGPLQLLAWCLATDFTPEQREAYYDHLATLRHPSSGPADMFGSRLKKQVVILRPRVDAYLPLERFAADPPELTLPAPTDREIAQAMRPLFRKPLVVAPMLEFLQRQIGPGQRGWTDLERALSPSSPAPGWFVGLQTWLRDPWRRMIEVCGQS
ncbi:MAG: hypothetical protein U0835_23270, partial [Isosphaeraceae bacterium]